MIGCLLFLLCWNQSEKMITDFIARRLHVFTDNRFFTVCGINCTRISHCILSTIKSSSSDLGRASPSKKVGFHLAFTWEKPALLLGLSHLSESPGLTTFIFPRNSESDTLFSFYNLHINKQN